MSFNKNLSKILNGYSRFVNGEWKNLYYLIALVLLVAWVFLFWLGRAQLVSWDEAIYASVARNIFNSGDFINLELNFEPYFNKPPLYIYLTTLAYHVFGINEFSARIVSSVFGIATVITTFLFTKKVIGPKEAILAALLLLSNFHFISIVRHGRMESMVTFLILISVIAFYNMLEKPKWVYLFALSTALAVLTKGLMGLFPLVIAGIFVLCKPSRIKSLFNIHTIAAIVIFLLIAVPWFVVQYLNYGNAYTDHFFGYQTFSRISDAISGHSKPWWHYFEVISVFYFSSWSVLIIPALLFFFWKTVRQKSESFVLIAIYALSILLIFSFVVQTKLHWYITSAYVPIAIITAYMLTDLKGKWHFARHLFIVVSLLYLVLYPFCFLPNGSNGLKNMKTDFRAQGENLQAIHSNLVEIPKLHYYSEVKINPVSLSEISEMGANGEYYFLMQNSHFDELSDNFEYTLIKKSGDYVFFISNGK